MARSVQRIDMDRDEAIRRAEVTRVAGKQRVLDAEFSDAGMVHHERMFDAVGELIYDFAVPMDYVVGSGRRAKAYLHSRGNRLFMSPLNWYSGSGRWDLAPGFQADDVRRFDRPVTDECLSCHAGRVASEGRSLNAYRTPAFHEMSIGCESCHGPGDQHVRLREADPDADRSRDTIVNPGQLETDRRESICNRCHLQAAARVPRYGRSDFDFRPGQRLEEIWSILDAGEGIAEDGRTRAVGHVQQMRESRCYIRSEGRLGCISCHDPHRVPPETERISFYRERCLSCHQERPCSLSRDERMKRDDSCIACHMPARDTNNVSHVTQTDHRVIRTGTTTVSEGSRSDSASLSFFNGTDRELESWERDRALGAGEWLYLTKKGRFPSEETARKLGRVHNKVPADGTVLTILGALANERSLTDRARLHFEEARSIPDAEEAALSGLLNIYYLSSEKEKALECADRLIQLDAGNSRVHALRADLLSSMGRKSEGIESALRALEFNPSLIPVRQWLVAAFREAGRDAERLEQERIVRRMETARPPAR